MALAALEDGERLRSFIRLLLIKDSMSLGAALERDGLRGAGLSVDALWPETLEKKVYSFSPKIRPYFQSKNYSYCSFFNSIFMVQKIDIFWNTSAKNVFGEKWIFFWILTYCGTQ